MEGFLENTKNTKDHEGTRRVEPQISEKHRGAQRGQRDTEAGGVLAHQDARLEAWRFRSLEAWKFGQASRCAAITKDTKNHKGARRTDGDRNRRCSVASLGRPYGISQIEQIKGVLPHAGLPVCFGNHQGHKGHKGILDD